VKTLKSGRLLECRVVAGFTVRTLKSGRLIQCQVVAGVTVTNEKVVGS